MNLQEYIKSREVEFDDRYSMNEHGISVVGKSFGDGGHAMWESSTIKNFHLQTTKGILEQVEKMCEENMKTILPPKNNEKGLWTINEINKFKEQYNSALSTLLQQLSEVKKNI